MYCTVCGARNDDGIMFCTKCGSRLGGGEAPRDYPSAVATCPHCGEPLEPNSRFCISCGQDVTNPDPEPEHKRRKGRGLLAGVAVLLVLAIGAGVFIMLDPLGLLGANPYFSSLPDNPFGRTTSTGVEDSTEPEDSSDEASGNAVGDSSDAKGTQVEADKAKAEAEAEAVAEAAKGSDSSGAQLVQSFPRTWSGTYDGHNGGEVLHRPITFRFTDVGEDGTLRGSVEIYVAEDNVTASYYVSGSVDWDTGYFFVAGSGWINSNGLDVMRNYEGQMIFSSWTVFGSTWNQEGDNYENWSASA